MLSVGAIQLFIMLLGLLRSKFLSVTLGPAGYGLVGTIDQIVLALISLGALGLPLVAVKFMAKSHSEGHDAFQRTYAGFLWALAFLGITTAAIGVGLGILAPKIFGHDLAPYRWLIVIAMLGIPAAMVNVLLANALAASQRGSRSALFTFAIQGVVLLAVVIGVYAGGTMGLYVATVAAGALTTFVAILLLRRVLGSPGRAGARWLVSELKRNSTVMSYSAWFYIASSVYALAMSGLRTFVFSDFGAVEAGLLQASLSLALTVGAVIAPMSNLILTPLLNRSMPSGDKVTAANEFASRVLTLLLIVALPLVLFPHIAVKLLFAAEFLPAAGFLFAFIIWQCLAQLVNVYTQLLIGLDDVAFACAAISLSYGTALLLAPPMMSWLGLPGAAVALTAGTVLGGVSAILRLNRRFHVSTSRRVLLRLAFCMSGICVGAVVSTTSAEGSSSGGVVRLAVALALLGLQWSLLDGVERRWVGSRFRQRGKK